MRKLDAGFTKELTDLIANSRLVAMDLGSDYISTLHFALADCSANNYDSIKSFLFGNDDEYRAFTMLIR